MATLLTLNLPPTLEEDLVDYLLALDIHSGFTSYQAMGHGEHTNLTIAEQVSGRRKRVQFEILLDDETEAQKIIAGLASEVGRDIRYWQIPVSGLGGT